VAAPNGTRLSIGISAALLVTMLGGAWTLASQIADRPTRDEAAAARSAVEVRLRTEQKEAEQRTEKRLDRIDGKLDKLLQIRGITPPSPRRTDE